MSWVSFFFSSRRLHTISKRDWSSDVCSSDLSTYGEIPYVKTSRARQDRGGGTWLHPKLAVVYARWLSVEFSVWCDARSEERRVGKECECRSERTDDDNEDSWKQNYGYS